MCLSQVRISDCLDAWHLVTIHIYAKTCPLSSLFIINEHAYMLLLSLVTASTNNYRFFWSHEITRNAKKRKRKGFKCICVCFTLVSHVFQSKNNIIVVSLFQFYMYRHIFLPLQLLTIFACCFRMYMEIPKQLVSFTKFVCTEHVICTASLLSSSSQEKHSPQKGKHHITERYFVHKSIHQNMCIIHKSLNIIKFFCFDGCLNVCPSDRGVELRIFDL